MMIHGMMLVRNEASRRICGEHIFKKVLNRMTKLCDRIVILDDNSTDNTVEFIHEYLDEKNAFNNEIYISSKQRWNTNELEARKQLFDLTVKSANNNDWLICLDADEVFVDKHIPYLKYLLESLSNQIDAIGFKLHDMWNLNQYRHDDYWIAHIHNWCMAIRYKHNKEYKWNEKTLHCGRFPQNAGERMLPTQIPLIHYGWADEKDRKIKYNRYMEIDPDGKNGILAQYKSILDTNPNLVDFGRCCIDD